MTTKAPIAEAFALIAERMAREHGTPLPKRVLTIGDKDRGWGIELNATADRIGDIDGYHAMVWWNGFPAGILQPCGGCLAAAANEDELCDWLKSDS